MSKRIFCAGAAVLSAHMIYEKRDAAFREIFPKAASLFSCFVKIRNFGVVFHSI